MSRNTGTFNFAANFEGLLKAPIDARQLVGTAADLTGATTWNASGQIWLYDGAIVSVGKDSNPDNNGIYFLQDADNFDDIQSWIKIAGSTDGIIDAQNGLSKVNHIVVLGGALTGNTTFDGGVGAFHLQYAGNYSSGFTKHSIVDVNYVTGITSVIEGDVLNLYDLLNVVEVINYGGALYDATESDEFIGVSGGTTVNLPNPPKDGQRIIIADVQGSANTNLITINGNGANILNGTSALINTNYGAITFIYSNNGFWSVAGFVN